MPLDILSREWQQHEMSVPCYKEDVLCDHKFIASGGMGAVAKYRNKLLGVDVAVKRCLGLSANDEIKLMREAKAQLNSATHPNIVSFYGFVAFNDGTMGLMLEYMPEGTLETVIHCKVGNEHYAYTRANVISWSTDIASALRFLHSKGLRLRHLDLKPLNILMCSNRKNVKIGDFGISKTEAASETGEVAGTRFFMAPETLTSVGSCCKSDVYSYAIVLWMMIHRNGYAEIIRLLCVVVELQDLNESAPYTTPTGRPRKGEALNKEIQRGLRPAMDPSLEPVFKEILENCWVEVGKRWDSKILMDKLAKMRDECHHSIAPPTLVRHNGSLLPPSGLGLPSGTSAAGAANVPDQFFDDLDLNMSSLSITADQASSISKPIAKKGRPKKVTDTSPSAVPRADVSQQVRTATVPVKKVPVQQKPATQAATGKPTIYPGTGVRKAGSQVGRSKDPKSTQTTDTN